MKYSFQNILGEHAIDSEGRLVKGKGTEKLPESLINRAIQNFRDTNYHRRFYEENMRRTKKDIRDSVTDDSMIIQAVRVVEELNHVANALVRRLRDWYELYNPEFSRAKDDHEAFVDLILKDDRKTLLDSIDAKDTMGADLDEESMHEIMSLASAIQKLYGEREDKKRYIESKMRSACPNTLDISGVMIGAKLIEHAGSLRHLSELPASTVQLLGAERALFKHIRTGAKCPKYGLIFNHPFVSSAKPKSRGKAARLLADKISIASKVDYFKGEYMADRLKKQLEKKAEGLL